MVDPKARLAPYRPSTRPPFVADWSKSATGIVVVVVVVLVGVVAVVVLVVAFLFVSDLAVADLGAEVRSLCQEDKSTVLLIPGSLILS